MPADIRFLDTDETTVITTFDFGSVATPGQSANKKLFVENSGDETAQSVTMTIAAIGTNDGDDHAEVALDSGGSPGTFGAGPLSLGNIAAGNTVPFWTRVNVASVLTADGNPRRYALDAEGGTI